jgi:hypothetical protein
MRIRDWTGTIITSEEIITKDGGFLEFELGDGFERTSKAPIVEPYVR